MMFSTRWIDTAGTDWHSDFKQVLDAAGMEVGLGKPRAAPTAFASDDHAVVGLVQGRVLLYEYNDRFGPFASLKPRQAMLDKIAVVPSARGTGIERQLMRQFVLRMQAERCTHVALQVDWSTETDDRIAFFTKCGFRSLIEGVEDDLLGAEIATVLSSTDTTSRR